LFHQVGGFQVPWKWKAPDTEESRNPSGERILGGERRRIDCEEKDGYRLTDRDPMQKRDNLEYA